MIRDMNGGRSGPESEFSRALTRALVAILLCGSSAVLLGFLYGVTVFPAALYGWSVWFGITVSSLIRGAGRPLVSALALSLDKALALVGIVILRPEGVSTVLWVLGSATLVADALFLSWLLRVLRVRPKWRLGSPFHGCRHFGIASLAVLASRLNVPVAGLVLSLSQLGVLSLGLRAAAPLMLLIGALDFVLLPSLARRPEITASEAMQRARAALWGLAALSLVCALGALTVVPSLKAFYGFEDLGVVLAVTCAGLPFAGVISLGRAWMLAQRLEREVAWFNWCVTFVYLVLIIMLGFKWGLLGAALAFPVSQAVGAGVYLAWMRVGRWEWRA